MTTAKLLLCSTLLLALTVLGVAQATPTPLTNSDVIAMTQKGMPVAEIVKAVKSGPTNFDISYPAMLQLQKAGVDPVVGNLMLQLTVNRSVMGQLNGKTTMDMMLPPEVPTMGATGATGPAGPPPVQKQQIQLDQALSLTDEQFKAQQDQAMQILAEAGCLGKAGPKIYLEPSHRLMPCQGASGNMAPGSHASFSGATTSMSSGFMIGGEHAVTTVPSTATFNLSRGELPKGNIWEYECLLIKLTPVQGARIVTHTTMRVTAKFPLPKWETKLQDSVVPARIGVSTPGLGYQVIPADSLAPGEYAIVLRKHGDPEMVIHDSSNDPALAVAQSVWDFSVAP